MKGETLIERCCKAKEGIPPGFRMARWLVILALPLTVGALTPEEALDLLRREGVDFAVPALQESVFEAMVRTVDPQGRVLTAEEARWVEQQRQGVSASQASMSSNSVESRPSHSSPPTFRPVEYWSREIAYLKVDGFYSGFAPVFGDALTGLNTAKVYGVILDLRGAGGGDLDSVARVAGWFCASNEWAVVRDRAGKELRRLKGECRSAFQHPLMILTDGQTREAPELLAALCRGQSRVMLIGIPTRGEAYLRDLIPLPDGRFLDFARYRLMPLVGEDYHGRGVTPDVDVAYARLAGESAKTNLTVKDARGRVVSTGAAAEDRLDERIGTDLILRRAVDLLLGLKALEEGDHALAGTNRD